MEYNKFQNIRYIINEIDIKSGTLYFLLLVSLLHSCQYALGNKRTWQWIVISEDCSRRTCKDYGSETKEAIWYVDFRRYLNVLLLFSTYAYIYIVVWDCEVIETCNCITQTWNKIFS
jgi:hypothetical protein